MSQRRQETAEWYDGMVSASVACEHGLHFRNARRGPNEWQTGRRPRGIPKGAGRSARDLFPSPRRRDCGHQNSASKQGCRTAFVTMTNVRNAGCDCSITTQLRRAALGRKLPTSISDFMTNSYTRPKPDSRRAVRILQVQPALRTLPHAHCHHLGSSLPISRQKA